MGAMAEVLAMDEPEFFAPVSSDLIDSLVGQYQATRQRIEQIADMVTGETAGAVSYFLEGNRSQDRYPPSVDQLFRLEGALAALNAGYWSKAMHLTDVLDYMPQARRDEWNKSITDRTCPEFEDGTVRDTLAGLMTMRSQFLAERVDGIFRGLSGEHVTNSPAAFGKRMIVGYVLSEYGGENYSKCGLINDLRCVIAKFMGRDEPGYNASAGLIRSLKGRWGEWVQVDGGALKVRLYRKGTAHIEVHPDMSWRLNATLAHLHPMAIPPEFRQKPKRKPKEIDLIQRPLPFAVVDILAQMKQAVRHEKQEDWRNPFKRIPVHNSLAFDYRSNDKHAKAEAETVLESIGGTKTKDGHFVFDYEPRFIIDGIVSSGCVPDDKAFQFYPTPQTLALRLVELAEIGEGDTCLEPSAGTGAIADLLPMERTVCVEVSALRRDVLTAKGHSVIQSDFLGWQSSDRFARICMNPPFDRGQWKAHLEHAASMLATGGRLVSILPASAKHQDILPALEKRWHGPFDNQFPGASVSVVILVAE